MGPSRKRYIMNTVPYETGENSIWDSIDGSILVDELFTHLQAIDTKNGKRLCIILYQRYIVGLTQQELCKSSLIIPGISRSMISKEENRAIKLIREFLNLKQQDDGTWREEHE